MTIYKAIEKAMEGQRVRTNTIFGECIIETDNKGNFFLRERKDNTQSALINAVKVNLQMGGKSNE